MPDSFETGLIILLIVILVLAALILVLKYLRANQSLAINVNLSQDIHPSFPQPVYSVMKGTPVKNGDMEAGGKTIQEQPAHSGSRDPGDQLEEPLTTGRPFLTDEKQEGNSEEHGKAGRDEENQACSKVIEDPEKKLLCMAKRIVRTLAFSEGPNLNGGINDMIRNQGGGRKKWSEETLKELYEQFYRAALEVYPDDEFMAEILSDQINVRNGIFQYYMNDPSGRSISGLNYSFQTLINNFEVFQQFNGTFKKVKRHLFSGVEQDDYVFHLILPAHSGFALKLTQKQQEDAKLESLLRASHQFSNHRVEEEEKKQATGADMAFEQHCEDEEQKDGAEVKENLDEEQKEGGQARDDISENYVRQETEEANIQFMNSWSSRAMSFNASFRPSMTKLSLTLGAKIEVQVATPMGMGKSVTDATEEMKALCRNSEVEMAHLFKPGDQVPNFVLWFDEQTKRPQVAELGTDEEKKAYKKIESIFSQKFTLEQLLLLAKQYLEKEGNEECKKVVITILGCMVPYMQDDVVLGPTHIIAPLFKPEAAYDNDCLVCGTLKNINFNSSMKHSDDETSKLAVSQVVRASSVPTQELKTLKAQIEQVYSTSSVKGSSNGGSVLSCSHSTLNRLLEEASLKNSTAVKEPSRNMKESKEVSKTLTDVQEESSYPASDKNSIQVDNPPNSPCKGQESLKLQQRESCQTVFKKSVFSSEGGESSPDVPVGPFDPSSSIKLPKLRNGKSEDYRNQRILAENLTKPKVEETLKSKFVLPQMIPESYPEESIDK